MDETLQAVVLAGGYGTRLKPFTDTNPKPMYTFESKPFLEYLVVQIKSFGITEILLLLGYMPEKIIGYFGDGAKWGVHIEYAVTPVEDDTGLRLRRAWEEGKLAPEFLLMYCDNYCPINFNQHLRTFRKNGALIQLTAYANRDGYTKNNLRLAEDGRVEAYDKKRAARGLQGVDIGYALVDRKALELMPQENDNFEKIVYPQLVARSELYATVSEHRYYSVGSWERIELTKAFFHPKKAVFLDRDGTLNVRPPKAQYIESPEEFVWLPGAREAVKRFKDAGYTVVLVSNQPGLARGRLTEETLAAIHDKMRRELAECGAGIDRIYFCPHNWDDGCECRKPKPGMLYQAQRDLSLDLTKCWMLGDDERDMHAGADAGCRCMMISDQHPLYEAAEAILKLEEAGK